MKKIFIEWPPSCNLLLLEVGIVPKVLGGFIKLEVRLTGVY